MFELWILIFFPYWLAFTFPKINMDSKNLHTIHITKVAARQSPVLVHDEAGESDANHQHHEST
jgi:hypothetical protein